MILTHLHYDHAGAAGQLPRATFLFDRREWAPALRGRLLEGYRRETVERPLNWRALDSATHRPAQASATRSTYSAMGRYVWSPPPGHSPGHLSVLLRTATGPVLVVGDAAYTRRAIAEGHDQIARADPAAYRTSLESLRRWTGEHAAAPIICSHDYEFWGDAPSLYA